MTKKRNRYTRAFKLEVIHLVTQQNYKIREAAEAMGVGQSTLEGWLAQYRREQSGITPVGAKALTSTRYAIANSTLHSTTAIAGYAVRIYPTLRFTPQ